MRQSHPSQDGNSFKHSARRTTQAALGHGPFLCRLTNSTSRCSLTCARYGQNLLSKCLSCSTPAFTRSLDKTTRKQQASGRSLVHSLVLRARFSSRGSTHSSLLTVRGLARHCSRQLCQRPSHRPNKMHVVGPSQKLTSSKSNLATKK